MADTAVAAEAAEVLETKPRKEYPKDYPMKEQVDALVDYIMKNCLWQFHSRAWDRERQNDNILGMTSRLVRGESVNPATAEERCYWADAVCLADAFKSRFGWLAGLSGEDKGVLMQGVKDRMDFLTITGSLNLELTDVHY
ncbi:Fe-only nitrogenase subunit delta [Treponema endosymbiont of Eucomonympha sp.]|uniref:Fe-only nitrogenase subunit delta n=1 Tax=Treponema endosymbiont of Eucomonympha sp. TaxID=1580831 RepID=UPI000B2B34B7|nr:Fe-only nitrogenase subunit delta [Treponema endosymbiont of Eucomonympha sp.]